MLFNSLIFPAFLLCVLTLHWSLRDHRRRNRLLLAASYVFYGWWDWRFLGLILLSSVVDYCCGLAIDRESEPARRRRWLHFSLAVNLGILGLYKYLGFFASSAASFLALFGFEADWPTLHLLLPVGISFYTFQTLSYTIDVYRGKCPPCRDFEAFLLFVSFFPQLVAGPIEKAVDLIPQVRAPRAFDPALAVMGLRSILLGYLLKSVVADNMAPVVDAIYGDASSQGALALVFGTYCFAFQIYGDFAGYSYIAIGVAALFSIRLRRNFQSPYLSQSVREFWKRWHISLSSWFAEYFYIGLLDGNRVGRRRHFFNVLATFTASGLWHGANWTFVFWGLLNGLLYHLRRPFSSASRAGAFANFIVCFHLTCFAWIFFRAATLREAFAILRRIFTGATGAPFLPPLQAGALTLAMVLLLAFETVQRDRPNLVELDWLSRPWRHALYYAALLLLFFCGAFNRQPFIYFQF